MFFVFVSNNGVPQAGINAGDVVVVHENRMEFCASAPIEGAVDLDPIAAAAVVCYGSLVNRYPGRVKSFDFGEIDENSAVGIVSEEFGAPAFLPKKAIQNN